MCFRQCLHVDCGQRICNKGVEVKEEKVLGECQRGQPSRREQCHVAWTDLCLFREDVLPMGQWNFDYQQLLLEFLFWYALAVTMNNSIGQPNAAVGACVAMDPMWGMWYSLNCTSFLAAYVCQTSPGVYGQWFGSSLKSCSVPQCPSPSYYFRGHCYYPLNAIGYGTVASTCSANCGNIASIHNDGVGYSTLYFQSKARARSKRPVAMNLDLP